MADAHKTYIPAAGHDWSLPFYDPLVRLLGGNSARAALVQQPRLEAGERVLEVGSGTGTLLEMMVLAFSALVVGSLWQRMLSRCFAWGWVGLVLILATGIGMVFLKFGGFSGVPMIHRGNMALGIPAFALFGYVFFGPWRRYRRMMSRRDWAAAQKDITRVRVGIGIILLLGLVASVVSAVGRYI